MQISESACLLDEAQFDWENLSQQVFSLDFDLFVDQTRQEGGRCPAVGEQEGTSWQDRSHWERMWRRWETTETNEAAPLQEQLGTSRSKIKRRSGNPWSDSWRSGNRVDFAISVSSAWINELLEMWILFKYHKNNKGLLWRGPFIELASHLHIIVIYSKMTELASNLIPGIH